MSKFLIKFESDWADEFQCEQFTIVPSKEQAQAIVERLIEEGGYFGTNEGFEEGELSECEFSITEITDEEADVICKLLGSEFGTGIL